MIAMKVDKNKTEGLLKSFQNEALFKVAHFLRQYIIFTGL